MGYVKSNGKNWTPNTMKFLSICAADERRRSVYSLVDRYAILPLSDYFLAHVLRAWLRPHKSPAPTPSPKSDTAIHN